MKKLTKEEGETAVSLLAALSYNAACAFPFRSDRVSCKEYSRNLLGSDQACLACRAQEFVKSVGAKIR